MVNPRHGRRNIVMAAMSAVTIGLLFMYPTSLGHARAVTTASAAPSTLNEPIAAAAGTAGSASSTVVSGSASSVGKSSGSSSTSTSSAKSTSGTKTYTGQSVNTRWGPVQVAITVANGKITKAQAVVYPSENRRDQEINAYAVPTLEQATISAQSDKIDTISGATVTSDGYISSLQSALDAANLG